MYFLSSLQKRPFLNNIQLDKIHFEWYDNKNKRFRDLESSHRGGKISFMFDFFKQLKMDLV